MIKLIDINELRTRCGECSSKHSFAGDLVKHIEEKGHEGDGNVSCPKCKESVPKAELVSHYEECVMTGPKANYSSGMAGSKATEDNALFKTEDNSAPNSGADQGRDSVVL